MWRGSTPLPFKYCVGLFDRLARELFRDRIGATNITGAEAASYAGNPHEAPFKDSVSPDSLQHEGGARGGVDTRRGEQRGDYHPVNMGGYKNYLPNYC